MKKNHQFILVSWIALTVGLSFLSPTIGNLRKFISKRNTNHTEKNINEIIDLTNPDNLKVKSFILNQNNKKIEYYEDSNITPYYYSIKNIGKQNLTPQIIVNNRDWSTGGTIIESIFQNAELNKLSNEEKVIKITEYLHQNINYPLEVPSYRNPEKLIGPVSLLNFFGYAHCSEFAHALAILGNKVGLDSKIYFMDKHVVNEIFYQNDWHMFDASLNVYLTNNQEEIASFEEILNNKNLLTQIENFDTKSFYANVFENPKIIEVENYPKENDELNTNISATYFLRPNEEIRFYYNWPNKYFYKSNVNKPENFTNGILITPVRYNFLPFQKQIQIKIPYPLLASYIFGDNLCNSKIKVRFSLDNQKWVSLNKTCQNNVIKIEDLIPKGTEAELTNKYFLKFTLPPLTLVKKLTVYTQFQISPFAIPKLTTGENIIESSKDNLKNINVNFAFSD